MAEFSSNAVQTVNPGDSILFTNAIFPCNRGFVRWRQGSGAFNLSGWVPNKRRCRCGGPTSAQYLADFGANIAVPTGQTVGPIQLSFAVDGSNLLDTTMIVTPAAVEEYNNVSRAFTIPVWNGCCQSFSIRNTSTIPILVQNANLIVTRPDLDVTY